MLEGVSQSISLVYLFSAVYTWSHELVTDTGFACTIAERKPASLPPESQDEPVFRDEMYAAVIYAIFLSFYLSSLLHFLRLKIRRRQFRVEIILMWD